MHLSNKVAVITGAGAGIGRAIASQFAAEGAQVVVADIDTASLEQTVAELIAQGANSGDVLAQTTDVSRAEDFQALFSELRDRFGGLDIIVNNAGVQRSARIEEYNDADFDLMMSVNPRSCYLAAKHGAPLLRERGGGAIVNVSSLAAINGGPGQSGYAASKGAIVALSRSLSNELAPDNIRVNALCPGWVDTPFNQPAIDFMGGRERLDQIVREGVPLGRQSTPAEIAKAALFLASDLSSYMTGEAMIVAGGAA